MVMQPVSLYSWPAVISQACVEAVLEEDRYSRDFVRGNYESLEFSEPCQLKEVKGTMSLRGLVAVLKFLGMSTESAAMPRPGARGVVGYSTTSNSS